MKRADQIREELDAFFEQRGKALLDYIRSKVRSRDDALDLFQETLRRAAHALARQQIREDTTSYIYGIAGFVLADYYASVAKDRERFAATEHIEHHQADDAEYEGPIIAKVDANRAAAGLTQAQLEVITERFIEGRGVREIAQRRGISERAIHGLIERALDTMRRQMGASK